MTRNISWALIAAVIFLHFMIASPAGFPLTVAPFALAYFIYKHYKLTIRPIPFLVSIFLLFWPLVILMRYDLFGGVAALGEFAKTYALWTYALLATLIVVVSRIRKSVDYSREFMILLGVIVSFALAQVLSARVLGTTALYYPFGDFSYKSVNDESRFVWDGFARAQAFYLEPSFCAFILFFMLAALLIREDRSHRIVQLLLGGLGSMLIVGSASGIFAVVGLAALILPGLVKRPMIRWLAAGTLLLVAVAGVLFLLPQRLAEVGVEGTSGYWRLAAPLIILSQVFSDFPLGIPFGQTEMYIEPMGLQHGANVGSSVDNGMYYLIFLFGWPAVMLLIGLLLKLGRAILKKDRSAIALWWFILISLQFSGGIFLSEYIFPMVLVIYTYKVEMQHRKMEARYV